MQTTQRNLTSPKAFTLIELLAAIAIIAALVTASLYFVGGYVQYAKANADKQTLAVLNDALTRYKCEGGNLTALTSGAPIGHVITALQTAATWGGSGGPSHIFLQKGLTYPARSLSSGGQGSSYVFYKYNSYDGYANGTVSKPTIAPYGGGVGYMANDGTAYNLWFGTSTNYWAWKNISTGVVTGPVATGMGLIIPAGNNNITFWSCSSSSTTPNGDFTWFLASSNLNISTLDVTGLIKLSSLVCNNNNLYSLDISQNTALTSLQAFSNHISSVNLSNNTALTGITLDWNPIGSIDISKLTGLTFLSLSNIGSLGSLDVSHNTALTYLGVGGCGLTTLDVSNNQSLSTLYCNSNRLGPIYLGGHTPATFLYSPQQNGYTPSLQ